MAKIDLNNEHLYQETVQIWDIVAVSTKNEAMSEILSTEQRSLKQYFDAAEKSVIGDLFSDDDDDEEVKEKVEKGSSFTAKTMAKDDTATGDLFSSENESENQWDWLNDTAAMLEFVGKQCCSFE